MYNWYMSNSTYNYYNKIKLLIILAAISIVVSSCVTTASAPTATIAENITSSPSPSAESTATTVPTATPYVWTAEYKEPKLLGSSHGIFCAYNEPLQTYESLGFLLRDSSGTVVLEQEAVVFEDGYYLCVNSLNDNTKYQLTMYYINEGKKIYSANNLEFTTAEKIYSDDEVNEILEKAITGSKYSEGSTQYYNAQTKRALKLIDINIAGTLGSGSYFLQMNQIKLEYSFNSYGRYVNWDMVDSYCDEYTLEILKDIISVNQNLSSDSFFYPFIPTPTSLYEYNKYDDEGGQFDAERYLYDNLLDDEEMYSWYLKYPFIYDTPEFQSKYTEIIEKNNESQSMNQELQEAIAYNKFMFSFYNRPWLDKYAVPHDETIRYRYIGTLVVQAATAYAYLVTEVPDGYENLIMIQSTRDYSTQASFYTRKAGMKNASEYSPEWHLTRQISSYVPGFSNHQYGISVDLNDIENFRNNPLAEYLQENANRYGFYNYYPEPWHWTYLGD